MREFLTDLTLLQQIFFIIAASSTLILIIQTILALIGMGQGETDFTDGGDVDIDAGTDFDADVDIDVGEDVGAVVTNAMHTPDTRTGFDSQGLRLFTIRGIVAFFMVGSWSAFILDTMGVNLILTCAGALLAGTASLYFIAKTMQLLLSLQADGTVKIRNALGQVGQVYIRIPANEQGMGKVNITVQEQFREFDAVTESEEMIKTGEMVYVTDVRAGNVLVVEKVEKQ